MKTIRVMVSVCLILLSHYCKSQTAQIEIVRRLNPLTITVGQAITTNLIFPHAIKSIDKGSRDLLVQKAVGVENVLQLKAGRENLEQTNITVITSDGQLYSFMVAYEKLPFNLNIEVGKYNEQKVREAIFSAPQDNEEKRDLIAGQVAQKNPTRRKPVATSSDVSIRLNGLYIKDDRQYFQVSLQNNSNINYHIDQLRLFIRDKQKAKRTAAQEVEVVPESITGNTQVIYSHSSQTVVLVIPKMTIPNQKYLVVQMLEKNGGRALSMKVENKHLLEASTL